MFNRTVKLTSLVNDKRIYIMFAIVFVLAGRVG